MPTEILISSDPWENRVAIVEDGTLSEIYFEREEKVIGSIYKGKVQNVLPGMGASFVDIGLGRNAFLYVDDINRQPLNIGDVEITQGRSGWTISEKVNRGDEVLVQIVKEPRGLKGARVSTNISLPGRYLILMPTGRYSGVSRKIESAEERNRLKAIMKRIRPEGMATIVRTAAAGVSEAELIADLGVMIRMWHGILESYKRAKAPALLHKDMNLVYKAARDFLTPDVESVWIDDAEEYEKVRDFLRLLGPQYLERVKYYNGNLFHDRGVDEEIQKLLRPKVWLPSGGYLIIEHTEALTVIDVNSGKFTGGKNLEDTIVKTNIEAAAEIARQVRMRDIGGIIVCDFIDMARESDRNKVIATLEAGLRKDRTRTTIQSFSALGLLEFTRKRVGKDLEQQLRGSCPTCNGLGTVMSPESMAIEALRTIRSLAESAPPGHEPVLVECAPSVGAQLVFWLENEKRELSQRLGRPIAVRVDATISPEKLRTYVVGQPRPGVREVLEELPPPRVEVGKEIEVELLNLRLPNPQSAVAVVNGFLVEVENAAVAVGQTVTIRILEIDEDAMYAEPESPLVALPATGTEGKRKRRRGGRGRKRALTVAEQTEELRELAEEASKGNGARPALGISTASEAAEEEAVEAKQDHAAEIDSGTIVIGDGETGEGRRRRRRRRRRRHRDLEVAAEVGIAPSSLEAQLEEPVEAGQAEVLEERLESEETVVAEQAAVGEGHRRRRRRRRRRGGRGAAETAAEAAESTQVALDREIFRVHPEGGAESTGERAPSTALVHQRGELAVEPPPPHLVAVPEEVKVAKPARRRSTRAKRGGEAIEGATSTPALPGVSEAVAEAAAVAEAVTPAEPAEKPKRRATRAKAAAAEPAEDAVDSFGQPVRAKRRTTSRRAPAPEPAAVAEEATPKRSRRSKAAAVDPAEVIKAASEAKSAVKARARAAKASAGTDAEAPAAKRTRHSTRTKPPKS